MPIPKELICECKRCGYAWVKRVSGKPKRCPKCISPYWDTKPGKLRRGRPPKKAAGRIRRG